MQVGVASRPFVGPVIAAHVNEFGRYPANKGLDEFGVAVAQWLGRRYALERPLDPGSEVLVLNDNFCVRIAELVAGETTA